MLRVPVAADTTTQVDVPAVIDVSTVAVLADDVNENCPPAAAVVPAAVDNAATWNDASIVIVRLFARIVSPT